MIKRIAAIIICALVLAGVWATFQVDTPVREAVVHAQGKKWKNSAESKIHGAVRKYGDWPPLMLAGGVGFLIAWRLGKRGAQRAIMVAMLASTLAGIVANASRLTTGRTRPRESPKIEQGFYGPWHEGKLTVGNSKYNSFPSGHTATAFGFAFGILFAAGLIWGGIAILIAGAIGWSSIAIGAHHPSDVYVSIILSFIVAWFTWVLIRDRSDAIGQKLRTWFMRMRGA